MTGEEARLQRQAALQASRRTLSWPEKIRLAERTRPSFEAFRLDRERRRASAGSGEARDAGPCQPPARREPE
jgi:hypothetical protein